jgi:hypothetical protein
MQVFIAGWTLACETIPWIGLLHYVYQIKKFGSPLRYYFGGLLFGIILDGQAQEINPSKRINGGHLHRVQHDILIFDFDFDLLTRVLAVWSC